MALLQSWGSLLKSGTCHDHYRRRGVRPLTLAFIVNASTTTVATTRGSQWLRAVAYGRF